MVYLLIALMAIFMCIGFFYTYIWIRVLASRASLYAVEIKEIKAFLKPLSR